MALHPALHKPIAHRGMHDAAGGVAENSASAFQRAIERGFGVECDLQLSADGEPMVIHDDTLDRVTAESGLVRERSAGELRKIHLRGSTAEDNILHFTELLNLIGGQVPLAVELKPHRDRNRLLAERAVALSKDYAGLLAFISFDPGLLREMHRAGYDGHLGVIVERFTSELALKHLNARQRFSMRHLLHYPSTRFNLIACDQHALTLPAVRLFHAIGMPVLTWTIISPAQADAALQHADQIAFEGFDPFKDKQ